MFSRLLLLATVGLASAKSGKWTDRFVVFLMENQGIEKTGSLPIYEEMKKSGTFLSNYWAITHPSYPNYIAMTAGDILVFGDTQKDLDVKHLGDVLEEAGATWTQYAENYPGKCNLETTGSGSYARRHTPFLSYVNVQKNSSRCDNMVKDGDQFWDDVNSGNLPDFSFYTPNCANDGHDTGLQAGAKWAQGFVAKALNNSKLMDGKTTLMMTYDESDGSYANHVLTIVWGKGAQAGAVDNTKYDHYSFLKTMEENWGAKDLGRKDATAVPFSFWNSSAY
jgi:phospholipase C